MRTWNKLGLWIMLVLFSVTIIGITGIDLAITRGHDFLSKIAPFKWQLLVSWLIPFAVSTWFFFIPDKKEEVSNVVSTPEVVEPIVEEVIVETPEIIQEVTPAVVRQPVEQKPFAFSPELTARLKAEEAAYLAQQTPKMEVVR